MRYIKNVFIAEMATIGIGVMLTIAAAIIASAVTGISNNSDAFDMGMNVGIVCGILLRIAMLVVLVVTIIKTSKTV